MSVALLILHATVLATWLFGIVWDSGVLLMAFCSWHLLRRADSGVLLLPIMAVHCRADACLAEAFRAVNPDESPPCPALEAASLYNCLATSSYQRIMVLTDIKINTTIFPPSQSDRPFIITRNISLEGDPRGPRMKLDCSLLTDRFQVAAGVTVKVQHVTLANCSIGAEKPLSFMRFLQGSQLVLNDTFLIQPDGLCLPQQRQAAMLAHEPRPTAVPGTLQSFRVGNASNWCALNPNTRAAVTAPKGQQPPVDVDTTSSASDNNSYSKLPSIPLEYASRTGLGPVYAATLDQPARVAFFTHPT